MDLMFVQQNIFNPLTDQRHGDFFLCRTTCDLLRLASLTKHFNLFDLYQTFKKS